MGQIAGYFTRKGSRSIPVAPAPSALPVPLVIPPGVYSIGSVSYDCRSIEGLVKVVVGPGNTVNRIIYQSDVYALLSGLCWLCTHGDEEERASGEAATAWITRMGSTAKIQKLRLRCGPTVEFVIWFLTYYGIQTRTVRWITMQDPAGQDWAGVDEGHVTLEAWVGGQWRNFDPDNGAFYTDASGTHVDARALTAIIADDSFITEQLDADAAYASEVAEAGETDLAGWVEITMMRDDGQGDGGRRWVRRIMQAVGWDHPNGEVWWLLPAGAESRASWVLGLQANYRIKTAAEIAAAFYP